MVQEDTTTATAPATMPQLQIVDRVSSLPLVQSSLDFAYDRYEKIKKYSGILDTTLSYTEQALSNVKDVATPYAAPIAAKFAGQIHMADVAACNGLDRLEASVPALKEKPEEIYKQSVEKAEGLKQYGLDRVSTAFANPYAQALVKSVDGGIDVVDSLVDYILPGEATDKDDESAERSTAEKANLLTDKVRRRVLKRTLVAVETLQKRSNETLAHIRNFSDLVAMAKSMEGVGTALVNEQLLAAQERAKKLWEELNSEEPEGSENDGDKNLEQRLVSIARIATKRVVDSYNGYKDVAKFLPENLRQNYESAAKSAIDVYKQIQQVSSPKDVSDVAMARLSNVAELMHNILYHTLESFLPTLKWFSNGSNGKTE